jgi:hypothetical protein
MMPDSWMIGGEGREAASGGADVQMHRSADGRFGKQHAGLMKEVRVAAFRGDPQALQDVLQRMRVGGASCDLMDPCDWSFRVHYAIFTWCAVEERLIEF